MKILRLEIVGFRSLKNVVWQPGALNIIIGPNGSGKSNLLRFLELISVSAQGRLGKYIQSFGGIVPLLWDGEVTDIVCKLKTISERKDPFRDALTYSFHLTRLGRGSSFRVEREQLANFFRVEAKEKPEPFKHLERTGARARIFDTQESALTAPEELIPEQETLLSIASGPFINNWQITEYQNQLASWAIYHDVHVHKDAVLRQPAVASLINRLDSDGQNLIPVLHTLYETDREFKRDINQAMCAAFGNDFDEIVFPPAADQRIQMRIRWKSLRSEQSASELSDGTLRFLLLLTILSNPSPPSVIAIDEPEIGLHPSMLPIIAEYAVDASTRTQVMLTTHSPQFLDAFTDTKPTTTVAQWHNGETTLKVLEGDQLAYWLQEYSLGALFTSGELEEMA